MNPHTLEIAYERSQRVVDATIDGEKTRLFRLQIWCLEEENNALHGQLSGRTGYMSQLENAIHQAREETRTKEEAITQLEQILQVKVRDNANLKTEIESLRTASKDSTKLLTEKLALSRELSTLKPEVDHLRAQCASSDSLLAEKLSQQRELNSLKVELETERRSLQRAISKDDGRSALEIELRAQLDTFQVELSRERKDHLKLQNEISRLRAEFEGQRTLFESKTEALRSRLKITREQLKEARTVTDNSRSKPIPNEAKPLEFTRNTRKRTLQEADEDATIGTPGDKPVTKKMKRGSTLPGDKSLFSTTPFLNRTANLNSGGRQRSMNHVANQSTEKHTNEVQLQPNLERSNGEAKQPVTQALKTQTNTKMVPKMFQDKTVAILDQVQEEGQEDHPSSASKATLQELKKQEKGDGELVNHHVGENAAPNKKKRRIFGKGPGKTIFDEDEGNTAKGDGIEKLAFSGPKRIPLVRPGGRMNGALVGAFSPLKKDRKS